MCINIYHKKYIQNFSYTLVHHLNKKKKIKTFQIFSVISTQREDVPYIKIYTYDGHNISYSLSYDSQVVVPFRAATCNNIFLLFYINLRAFIVKMRVV